MELVMVIVILGIVAGIATVKLTGTLEGARYDATKAEMEALAHGIAGDPNLYGRGARTDFGYVGDVGALPPNLDALAANPGYATWHGPYIRGDFATADFKNDGWNSAYLFQDTLLRSTGSGTNIDKIFASSRAMLLSNTVIGYIYDADHTIPGQYKDSLSIILSYPNGTGGMATSSATPDAGGHFSYSGIPVGNHRIRVIYRPDHDTVTIPICVLPGVTTKLDITFPADLW